ncbi:MAG: hypothetical protein QNJ65_15635 [Xenococcaceae cyanobacterium MO_234.B1]|nr:hypothetical protein [Xenococcaceae cyanobacterium MO_234.B1]
MAAEAGLLWTNTQLGKPERKLEAQVKELASIAKDNEAIAQGLSWGLAFAYGGRDALSTRGDVEVALSSARLAQTIFEVFDTPLRQAQIYSDRAEALAVVEDFEASLLEMEKALVCRTQIKS